MSLMLYLLPLEALPSKDLIFKAGTLAFPLEDMSSLWSSGISSKPPLAK